MSRRVVWFQVFQLSPREDFVCRGLTEDMSYKEIAGMLDVSTPTVKTLAQRAMDKFGVDDWRSLSRAYELAREMADLSSRSAQTIQPSTTTNGHVSG